MELEVDKCGCELTSLLWLWTGGVVGLLRGEVVAGDVDLLLLMWSSGVVKWRDDRWWSC